jgi:hypothetical protein
MSHHYLNKRDVRQPLPELSPTKNRHSRDHVDRDIHSSPRYFAAFASVVGGPSRRHCLSAGVSAAPLLPSTVPA